MKSILLYFRRSIVILIVISAVLLSSGCSSAPWRVWKDQRQNELEAGSRIADTRRGPVEYALEGSGPVVLILHGSMGGYDSGLAIGEVLADTVRERSEDKLPGFTLLSVSRPGYLRTPLSVGESTEEQADAMAEVLDILDIDKVAVAGGSGGGPVAFQFALRHPDRCWGLVLLCSVFEARDVEDFPVFQRMMFSMAFNDRNGYRTVRRMERNPEKVLSGMHPGTAALLQDDPTMMDMAVLIMYTSFPMSLRKDGTYNDIRREHGIPWEKMPEIAVPTIILNGTDDQWAPVDLARRAAREIPGARYVEFEGADHLFFITQREKFVEELGIFLKEHYPVE